MNAQKMLLLACLVLSGFVSCKGRQNVVNGVGAVVSLDKYYDGSINGIVSSLSAPLTIEVQPGAKTHVQLKGYENLLQLIEIRRQGNELKLGWKSGNRVIDNQNITVSVVLSSLAKLELHGANEAKVNTPVTGDQLTIDLSGATEVVFDRISVKTLNIASSGSTNVGIASGAATKAFFDVSGAGDIDAFGLQANEVDVEVSGSGSVDVSAITSLAANISGAGAVRYKGNPIVKSKISGAGEVVPVR